MHTFSRYCKFVTALGHKLKLLVTYLKLFAYLLYQLGTGGIQEISANLLVTKHNRGLVTLVIAHHRYPAHTTKLVLIVIRNLLSLSSLENSSAAEFPPSAVSVTSSEASFMQMLTSRLTASSIARFPPLLSNEKYARI